MPKEIVRLREAELYRIAAFLFNKYGYASTSMRQICRGIGIRESSLYHYIRSKEDLLYHICEQSMLLSLEAIEAITNLNSRPDFKLKKMIETHITTIAENANEHSTMLKELRSLGRSNQRKIIKLRDRYEALFRKVIADCVHKRVFRDVDVKITTLALLGMMNWLIHWYAAEGPMKSEEIARIFSDLFLKRPRR
jgi:AcrR family transcriptional regulator